MNRRRGSCTSDAGAVRLRRRGPPPPRVWIRVSQPPRSGTDDLNRRYWVTGAPQLRGGESPDASGRVHVSSSRPPGPTWPWAAPFGTIRLSLLRSAELTAWAGSGRAWASPPPPRLLRPGPAGALLSRPFPPSCPLAAPALSRRPVASPFRLPRPPFAPSRRFPLDSQPQSC